MANIKHSLPPEAILNNEYHILMPIGKGGFSITYLAERICDGMLVAIKELYNSNYMNRITLGQTIYVRDNSCLPQFERDKKKFSYEWDVMKQFENCYGMVKPIDYFEENNTVYIVMEHLSGGSLKDNVRTKGPYKVHLLLKEIDQVLAFLSEMHKQGFIHGDISPDNLVMSQDGHYKLIDFGGVRRIGSSYGGDNILRKEGYTAAEAFNSRAVADAKVDIYSLCAVLYYSLTGTAPEDSLERLLADGLHPLSDQSPELDPLIGDMIMKGLSMNPADRWSKIEELQETILQFNRSEDDRKKELSDINRDIIKRKILISSCIMFSTAFFIFVFFLTHKELLLFHGKETQKIVFYFDKESTPEKIDILQSNIEKKIKHITGTDAYIVRKSGDFIEATIQNKSVEPYNVPILLNKYFNFSRCSIGVKRNDAFFEISEINNDNVDFITDKGEAIFITPSKSLLNAIEEYEEKDTTFILRIYTQDHSMYIWDKHNIPLGGETYDVVIEFDSISEVMVVRNTVFDHDIEKDLFIDCISQQSIPISSFNYSRQISWESEQNSFGKNQLNISQIKGETLLLDYMYDDTGIGNREKATIKTRLDALEIPYACGHDITSNDHFYLATSSANLWEIEAALLFENIDAGGAHSDLGYHSVEGNWGSFYIKSPSGIVLPFIDSETALTEKDGHVNVKVTNPEKTQDVVKRIIQNGEDSVYLYIANRPCFRASVSSVSLDGWISFDEIVLENCDEGLNDTKLKHFVDYLNTILDNYEDSDYFLVCAQFLNSNGTVNWNKDIWNLQYCEKYSLSPDKVISNPLVDQSLNIIRDNTNPAIINVRFNYDTPAKNKYPHPYAIVRDVIPAIESAIDISEVDFTITQQGEYTTFYYMNAYRDPYTGKIQMEWDINYWNYNEDLSDPDEHHQVVISDNEKTRDFLASDTFFTSNYLNPALENKYEKTILDNEDLLIELYVKNTLPGQGYQFAYHVDNRTENDVSITIEKIAINSVMADVSGFGGYIFGADSSGIYNGETFTERELHFPVAQPFRNASIDFKIESNGKQTHEHVEIPDNKHYSEWMNNVTIPLNARLIDETDKYALYCQEINNESSVLGKEASFIIINKSDKILFFDFTRLDYDVGYDLVDNYSFISEPAEVLPRSALFYSFNYSSLWEGDISAYIIQLQVSYLDNNGSLIVLADKKYRIDN